MIDSTHTHMRARCSKEFVLFVIHIKCSEFEKAGLSKTMLFLFTLKIYDLIIHFPLLLCHNFPEISSFRDPNFSNNKMMEMIDYCLWVGVDFTFLLEKLLKITKHY